MCLNRAAQSVVCLAALCWLTLAVDPQIASKDNAGSRGQERSFRVGLVVERVTKDSEAERVGIQVGDVISGWRREDTSGQFDSPFDLAWIEIDQAPRGLVNLEGMRGSEKRSWILGPTPWGIDVRPDLQGPFLDRYLTGRQLLMAGNAVEASKVWQEEADDPKLNSQPSWMAAWFLFRVGQVLSDGRYFKKADSAYQEAIEQARTASPLVAAEVFESWAESLQKRNNWASATKYYQLAADEAQILGGENLVVAMNLSKLGAIAMLRQELAVAEADFNRALAIQEEFARGSLAAARTLGSLSNVDFARGDLAKAAEHQHSALLIKEKWAPGGLDVATSLNNLSVIADEQGDLDAAEDYGQRALAIREKLIPDSLLTASTLSNLGNVAQDRGDLATAEMYQRRALATYDKMAPDDIQLSRILNNLGSLADDRDDPVLARKYLRRALAIDRKQAPGSLEVAYTLNILANVALDGGNLDEAERYQREALIIEEREAPGTLEVAYSLANVANIAQARGEFTEAEKNHRAALSIRQQKAPNSLLVAISLAGLASVARERGDLVGAEENYRCALAISAKLAPESMQHADQMFGLASVLRDQKQNEAEQLYAQALQILENQTSRLSSASDARSQFRARHADYYKDYIDLLIRLKQPERAFHVLEQSRARSLLETLINGHVNVSAGVDPALLRVQHQLERALSYKLSRRIALLSGEHNNQEISALDMQIAELLAHYQEQQQLIRANDPKYAALTQPRSLEVAEVQRLLNADTLLVEYSLGTNHSYVFVATPNALIVRRLARRSTIEAAARRVYALLTARNLHKSGETSRNRQMRLAQAEAEYPLAAARLSRMILAPIANELQGKRLLIVNDGFLHYIPFAALPVPMTGDAHVPLVMEHEIVILPSASVFSVLRKEQAGKKLGVLAVAVLADPVFDVGDIRVKSAASRAGTEHGSPLHQDERQLGELYRSAADVGWRRNQRGEVYLPRLRFSRQEAEMIAAVTPSTELLEALDFNASRATATRPDLSNYRILHFATHALLDNKHPELSGLVLSLVDEQGKPLNGFLGLQDIYNLNLPVELVVLSACQSGLGKRIEGEGVIGLTRGFMYAGAARVVASLWSVDDQATAELMAQFYRAMQQNRMTPAAALRQAQVFVARQKRWSFPHYWAAFQIYGEWR